MNRIAFMSVAALLSGCAPEKTTGTIVSSEPPTVQYWHQEGSTTPTAAVWRGSGTVNVSYGQHVYKACGLSGSAIGSYGAGWTAAWQEAGPMTGSLTARGQVTGDLDSILSGTLSIEQVNGRLVGRTIARCQTGGCGVVADTCDFSMIPDEE